MIQSKAVSLFLVILLMMGGLDLSAQSTFQRFIYGFSAPYLVSSITVQETADGGYILGGTSTWDDPYLIKINSEGFRIWERRYTSVADNVCEFVLQTSDLGFVMVGYTSEGNGDVLLIKTDSLGDTLWTNRYGGSAYDNGYHVAETPDGGFIITGRSSSFGSNAGLYLVRTNSVGDLLWSVPPNF